MRLIETRPWRHATPRKPGRPLRCMFIITSMPVGGAETLLVNLMRRMDRRVVRPEVTCLKEPGPLAHANSTRDPGSCKPACRQVGSPCSFRLIQLLRRRETDVVITVGAGDKMFWGRLAAHLSGVPVIASALHSTGWPDGVGKLNRCLTSITDAFIAVADAHGQFLKDFEQFPTDKVHVIRNGVDCRRFVPDCKAYHACSRRIGTQSCSRVDRNRRRTPTRKESCDAAGGCFESPTSGPTTFIGLSWETGRSEVVSSRLPTVWESPIESTSWAPAVIPNGSLPRSTCSSSARSTRHRQFRSSRRWHVAFLLWQPMSDRSGNRSWRARRGGWSHRAISRR